MKKLKKKFERIYPDFQTTEVAVSPSKENYALLDPNRVEYVMVISTIKIGGRFDVFTGMKVKKLTRQVKNPADDGIPDMELIMKLPRISFSNALQDGDKISWGIRPSHFMAFEFVTKDEPRWIRYQLKDLGFVAAIYGNIYGRLTVIIRAEYSSPEEYKENFKSLKEYFESEFAVEVDLRGADATYANVINFDPNAYINFGAVPFQAFLRHF